MQTQAVKEKFIRFHLPTKPYSLCDAINRCAAGQGTVAFAQAAADSDYNGHAIGVHWNDYRGYYVAEYFWGERVVVSRGSAEQVLAAAVREFKDHQGRGSSFSCGLKESDAHLAAQFGLIEGDEPVAHDWYTPLHGKVGEAMMWERNHLAPAFAFLASSKTVEEYEVKMNAHFARVRQARAASEVTL